MVTLKEIQEFCNNKNIAIVGNSSKLLKQNYGELIDSFDIIIRINNAPLVLQNTKLFTGLKTHIYQSEMSCIKSTINNYTKSKAKYFLKLLNYNNDIDLKRNILIESNIQNSYYGNLEIKNNIYKQYSNAKPSSGAILLYFIENYINYKSINLFGFDFFKTSTNKMNIFKSFNYKDHNTTEEERFFKKYINGKSIKLY